MVCFVCVGAMHAHTRVSPGDHTKGGVRQAHKGMRQHRVRRIKRLNETGHAPAMAPRCIGLPARLQAFEIQRRLKSLLRMLMYAPERASSLQKCLLLGMAAKEHTCCCCCCCCCCCTAGARAAAQQVHTHAQSQPLACSPGSHLDTRCGWVLTHASHNSLGMLMGVAPFMPPTTGMSGMSGH